MNFNENSALGRKVFFVNSPYFVTNTIIPRLTELEYEVYTLDTYMLVKPVLKKYPDSICFLNIDCEDLSYDEWFNFASSFEDDEVLSTIMFGVICQHTPRNERERFMMDIQLPAGVIQYIPDLDTLFSHFKQILDINGAMGKRKYIRADCGKNPRIYAEIDLRVKKVPLLIQNISSVGIACFGNETHVKLLEDKTVYRTVLYLENQAIPGSLVVLTKRVVDGHIIIIMLFGQGFGLSSRSMIREFIRKRIQSNLNQELTGIGLDQTDYSVSTLEENNAEEAAPESNETGENETASETSESNQPENPPAEAPETAQ